MKPRTIVVIVQTLAALCMTGVGSAAAQDSLGAVKTLYASAAYEEALTAIDRLHVPAGAPDARALDQYRIYCLLALGRDAEATRALEELVGADPFFVPSADDVAPRVRTLFASVRGRVLPNLVQQKYASAKEAYDRKDYASAIDQFDLVLKLIDEPDLAAKRAALSDVKTLAAGFLELARVAATPPPPPPKPEPPAAPVPPAKTIFDASDAGVVAPVVQTQDVPPWTTMTGMSNGPMRPGVIEIVIDEAGHVTRATMRQPIHPAYDPQLLSAAAGWRYKPATKDGVAVKYRKLIQVTVERR